MAISGEPWKSGPARPTQEVKFSPTLRSSDSEAPNYKNLTYPETIQRDRSKRNKPGLSVTSGFSHIIFNCSVVVEEDREDIGLRYYSVGREKKLKGLEQQN